MRSLLKLHFQKTFFTWKFVAFLGTAVLLSIASIYFLQNVKSVFMESSDLLETFHQGNYYNFGMFQVDSIETILNPHWKELVSCILNSSSMAMLLSTGIVINITKEFQYGGFFSAIAKGYSPLSIYISYILTMFIFTVILSIIYLLAFVCSAISCQMPEGNIDIHKCLQIIMVQILMLGSYSTFCTTLAVFLQRPVTALLFGLVISATLPSIFAYFKILYHTSFDFESYWVLSRLGQLSGRLPNNKDFFSAFVLIVISFLAGAEWIKYIKIRNK